jgi:enediyne biosynthesis protein E5
VFNHLCLAVKRPWQRRDPRLYQIAALTGLFGYGVVWLDFAVSGWQTVAILATVLLTQALCSRLWQLPVYDPYSALVSGLSLCLLLRTNTLSLAVLTAVITIVSKFVLRWRGKHLFNPTNFGLVAMMLGTGQVWVSPGQWGSAAFFAFFMACCGGLVVYRAARSDVTYAFLVFHIALRFGRALWLGDPLSIPLHQLQNGALVLFTFFMISDPRTTPDTRLGRIVFAGLVALGAWYVQFTDSSKLANFPRNPQVVSNAT